MKFLYTAYDIHMDLQENCGHYLVIEHPRAYAEIVHDLYCQCDGGEGGAILSDGTKSVSFAKQVAMILEPFSLQFDTRKINTALYKELEDIVQDGYYMDYLTLQSQLAQFMARVTGEVPYPISYDAEAAMQGLCKWLNVHVDYMADTLAERLSGYIELLAQLCRIKVVFLVGIELYLSQEERRALQKMANYHKIYIIYISNRLDVLSKIDVYTVVDADYCIITNNPERL